MTKSVVKKVEIGAEFYCDKCGKFIAENFRNKDLFASKDKISKENGYNSFITKLNIDNPISCTCKKIYVTPCNNKGPDIIELCDDCFQEYLTACRNLSDRMRAALTEAGFFGEKAKETNDAIESN